MKSIVKYGMALLALLAPITFQSCHDDKDIVVITEELPLKVDHLYMVGDATPAGWSIDNPFEMTRDTENKYLFTYHGKLKTGEIKLPLSRVIGVLHSFTHLLLIQKSMIRVLPAMRLIFAKVVLIISGRLQRLVSILSLSTSAHVSLQLLMRVKNQQVQFFLSSLNGCHLSVMQRHMVGTSMV